MRVADRVGPPRLPSRAREPKRGRVASVDRVADGVLFGLCALAALLAVLALVMIAFQVTKGARLSISQFGLGFLGDTAWKPNFGQFGAATLLFGTAVSSAMALALAAPIGISIGIYLSMLAPRGVRATVGPLVEMLAAIPSVILGFWGILILAPFVQRHMEPWLHHHLGFIPIFGTPQTTGTSIFTAGLVLTIMVVPIIASISRDLFLTVPRDLQDGAAALGATRWEIVRGVVLPSTGSGVAAACFLGLGRAVGEAIAVSQVVGNGTAIHSSLFSTGDTMASRIAEEFAGATTKLHQASLYYLAVLLLVIGVLTNLFAQWIGRRFDYSATSTGVSR
jgi:phosphate transport system permease protein